MSIFRHSLFLSSMLKQQTSSNMQIQETKVPGLCPPSLKERDPRILVLQNYLPKFLRAAREIYDDRREI